MHKPTAGKLKIPTFTHMYQYFSMLVIFTNAYGRPVVDLVQRLLQVEA